MKNYTTIIAICFISLAVPLFAQNVDFARLAPEETLAFVQVRDFEALQKRWAETPIGKIWADEAMQKFTESLRKDVSEGVDEFLENYYLDRESQKKLFNHQVALYIGKIKPLGTGYVFEICLIAKRGGTDEQEYKKFVDEMLAEIPERAERNLLEAKGEKIYQIKFNEEMALYNNEVYTPEMEEQLPESFKEQVPRETRYVERNIQYAFVDDLFLFCDGSDDTLAQLINQLRNESLPSLANTQAFQRTFADQRDGGDIRLYFSMDEFSDYLLESAAELDRDEKRVNALGLDLMHGIGLTLNLDRGDIAMQNKVIYSNMERGLPALIGAFRSESQTVAQLAPKNLASFQMMSIHWSELYRRLRSIMSDLIGPQMIGILDMQLEALNQQLQIDLEQDLLASLGKEAAKMTFPPDPEDPLIMPEVYVLELTNADKIRGLLDTLMHAADPPGQPPEPKTDQIPYQGYTITTLKTPQGTLPLPGDRPYWFFTDRFVAFSPHLDALKNVIRVLRNEEPNITSSDMYRQGRRLVEGKPDFVAIGNLEVLAEAIHTQMQTTLQNNPMVAQDSNIDPNMLPPASLFKKHLYLLIESMQITDRDLTFEMLMKSKE